jgi:hypothetical protein
VGRLREDQVRARPRAINQLSAMLGNYCGTRTGIAPFTVRIRVAPAARSSSAFSAP